MASRSWGSAALHPRLYAAAASQLTTVNLRAKTIAGPNKNGAEQERRRTPICESVTDGMIAMLLGLTASEKKNLDLVQNLVQNCVRFVIGDTVEGSTIPAG